MHGLLIMANNEKINKIINTKLTITNIAKKLISI